MAFDPEGTRGGFASTYLNYWQMKALWQAADDAGFKPFGYVGIIILERLVADKYLPQEDLDRYKAKLEKRKDKPHGNAKIAEAPVQPSRAEIRAARRRRMAP